MNSFIGRIVSMTHYTKCPECGAIWIYNKNGILPSMSCRKCKKIFNKETRYIGSYIEYDDSAQTVAEILAEHIK